MQMSLRKQCRKSQFLLAWLVKQGGDNPPVDFPLPFEEEVLRVLLEYFRGKEALIESELIVQGRLLTLLQASYNPETGSFREDLFRNYLETHFNEVSINEIYSELSIPVLGAWEAGSLAMEDSLEEMRTGVEDTTGSGVAVSQALAWGAILGASSYIYLSGIRTAIRGSESISQANDKITSFLQERLDSRAENYYNMASAWAISQSRNFGRLATAKMFGVPRLVWKTAGDTSVCSTCTELEGMSFSVETLYSKMEEYADASNTEQAKSVLPWKKEVGGFFEFEGEQVAITQENADTLAMNGVGIPPIHGECRCTMELEE